VTLVHDIWLGDSKELCKRFQPKRRVNCVITDPPFGVNNKSNMAKTVSGAEHARKIAADRSVEEARREFDRVMDVLLPATVDHADLYVFTNGAVLKEWLQICDDLARHSYVRKGILVWAKEGPGLGDLEAWGQAHEYIIFLKKGDRPSSDRRRSGVLFTPQVRPADLIHPHEKPEALLADLIRHSTDRGDFLVDPFGGSGSLVRAARLLDRSCVAIESDEFNHKKALTKLAHTEGGLFG
jgi:adenine-specific DNA-methyltransferase